MGEREELEESMATLQGLNPTLQILWAFERAVLAFERDPSFANASKLTMARSVLVAEMEK